VVDKTRTVPVEGFEGRHPLVDASEELLELEDVNRSTAVLVKQSLKHNYLFKKF